MYHATRTGIVEFDVTYNRERFVAKTALGNVTFLEWGDTPEDAARKIQERIDIHERRFRPGRAERIKDGMKDFLHRIFD